MLRNHWFISSLKVLNQWIMDQVPLGNKVPRPGFARQLWCPACRGFVETPIALTSGHVLLECMAVEGTWPEFFETLVFIFYSGTRMRECIRSFLDECEAAGRSQKSAHYLFVNGFDPKWAKISVKDHLKRGASLARLVDMWLSTWGHETDRDMLWKSFYFVINQDLLLYGVSAFTSRTPSCRLPELDFAGQTTSLFFNQVPVQQV